MAIGEVLLNEAIMYKLLPEPPLPYQRLGYSLGPADLQGADVWEKITDCPPMPSHSKICARTAHALRIEQHVVGEQSNISPHYKPGCIKAHTSLCSAVFMFDLAISPSRVTPKLILPTLKAAVLHANATVGNNSSQSTCRDILLYLFL